MHRWRGPIIDCNVSMILCMVVVWRALFHIRSILDFSVTASALRFRYACSRPESAGRWTCRINYDSSSVNANNCSCCTCCFSSLLSFAPDLSFAFSLAYCARASTALGERVFCSPKAEVSKIVSGRDEITFLYSSSLSARGPSSLPGSGNTNSPFGSAA